MNMEKKKLDINTLIGIVLIAGILIWMSTRPPSQEQLEAEQTRTEQVESSTKETPVAETIIQEEPQESNTVQAGDSLALEGLKNRLGSFAYSGALPSAEDATSVIENDVLRLEVSNKGGYIVEAMLKEHTQYLGE
ncbi:MAG: membrane protein insertase YidC, partial [Flavobacteriaceae bacterium]|nr:membrane protein insertase YidC [Flavobacteriaceae bacterium]